ncbi:MAG: hypothetical protein MJB14_21515 [Spirochaetes bacterium]|nr:hypothetical protein [Spirochaetota bacterium]
MLIKWSQVKIFIKPGITDMRKQINGLSVIVDVKPVMERVKRKMMQK